MAGVESSKVAGFIRVGKWGRQSGDPQNVWSFELEKDHKLVKITVDHGDVIYSLMFTTKYKDALHNSDKFGGWNGGDTVSEVSWSLNSTNQLRCSHLFINQYSWCID